MLEVRYIESTGVITAWASSSEFTGGHLESKDGQNIIVLDCHSPTSLPGDYLIIDGKLVLTKEPELLVDLATEIRDLKMRVEKLEVYHEQNSITDAC